MGKARRPQKPKPPPEPEGEKIVECNMLEAIVFLNWCPCFWRGLTPPCE